MKGAMLLIDELAYSQLEYGWGVSNQVDKLKMTLHFLTFFFFFKKSDISLDMEDRPEPYLVLLGLPWQSIL